MGCGQGGGGSGYRELFLIVARRHIGGHDKSDKLSKKSNASKMYTTHKIFKYKADATTAIITAIVNH